MGEDQPAEPVLPWGYRHRGPEHKRLKQTKMYEKMGGPCRIDDDAVEEFRKKKFDPKKIAEAVLKDQKPK